VHVVIDVHAALLLSGLDTLTLEKEVNGFHAARSLSKALRQPRSWPKAGLLLNIRCRRERGSSWRRKELLRINGVHAGPHVDPQTHVGVRNRTLAETYSFNRVAKVAFPFVDSEENVATERRVVLAPRLL
jgi:hypothetical protein